MNMLHCYINSIDANFESKPFDDNSSRFEIFRWIVWKVMTVALDRLPSPS